MNAETKPLTYTTLVKTDEDFLLEHLKDKSHVVALEDAAQHFPAWKTRLITHGLLCQVESGTRLTPAGHHLTGYILHTRRLHRQIPATLDMVAAERMACVRALAANQGNKRAAARALVVGKTTLYRKIRDYDIETV